MHPADLSSLSTLKLLELKGAVDSVLCVVAKVSTVKESQKVEERMRKVITQAWQGVAAKTLTSALSKLRKGPYTQKRINTFLAQFGIKLKDPLTKEQIVFVEKQINEIWKISKKIGAKEAKFKPVFDLVDRRAVRAINKQQVFWIGDFYSDKLSKRIRAVSNDVLLKQGLSHNEAAEVLGKALRQEFGLVEATQTRTKFAPQIPARYAGRSEAYLRQVASTAAHQARSFGRLTAYRQADVKRIRFTNPMDDRTGRICRQMNGQIVTVRAATVQMDAILTAKTPRAVKRVAPWLSGKNIENMLGNAKPGSPKATNTLDHAGIAGDATIIPPFHGECLVAGTPVVTKDGMMPIEKVGIGDLVLTHKGRFKPVVVPMKHQVTGSFMEIVVQSTKIGITPNHPILEADGETFSKASELDSNSWIKTLKEGMQNLQFCNVCGSIKIPCSMLLKEMQISCQRSWETRQEDTSCISCLCPVWRNLLDTREQTNRSWQGTVLQQSLQIRESVSEDCKMLCSLQCNLSSEPIISKPCHLFSQLSQYVDSYWQEEIRHIQSKDVWKKQPNVWERLKAKEVDQSTNRVQWYNRCERQVGGDSSKADRQLGAEDALRTKEVLSRSRYDVCSRFLHTILGSLDRSGSSRGTKKKEKTSFVQEKDRPNFDSTWPQSLLLSRSAVEQVSRYQVTKLPVFNLEVEEDHTYVAGGVVMHNCRTEFEIVD
jgi:hypothetical protein